MIPSLLLSTLSIFATPVFISEVRATREPGHLRVEVRGEAGIDPEAARTRIDGGRLLLVLGGTRVRADNRSWPLEEGEGEIRAHRHPDEIELDVPIGGNGCSGPVELEGTATGLTALVGCDGPARATRGAEAAKATAMAESTRKPAPVPAKVAATAIVTAKEKTALDALVALPEDEPATASAVKVAPRVAKADAPAMAAPAAAEAVSAKASKAPEVAAAPTTPAKPLLLPAPAGEGTDAGEKASEPSAPRLRAVSLPAVLLAGLAIAAYVVARRRRVPKLKQIQILETASLGPKRSLVVARIGEETLVLGTSEAGITLLKTSGESVAAALPMAMVASGGTAPIINFGHTPTAALPMAAMAPQPSREMNAFGTAPAAMGDAGDVKRVPAASAVSDLSGAARAHAEEMAQPLMEALADIPDPAAPQTTAFEVDAPQAPSVKGVTFRAIEGGLASLFGGGRSGSSSSTSAPNGRATSARFDDILEDSLEDQELRRKLATGLSARVR